MFCLIRKQSVCLRRSSAMPVQCIAYNKFRRLLKMVTRLSRSIAAIGLAVIMICMFAFPTVASVAAAQPKRIINVQVIYDESFRAFALNELGENPLQRLRAALKYAAYPYERIWNVDLRFNFQTYESMLGSPYTVQPAWPDSCSALWSWQTDPQTGERYRSWNHYSRGCTCFPDDECFISSNTPGHHNSASRLIYKLADDVDRIPDSIYSFDATAWFVGHNICRYANERHKTPAGISWQPYDVLIVSAIHSFRNGNETTGYTYTPTENFMSNARIFQHEFSHLFSLPDALCPTDEPCIMSGGFDNIVLPYDIWCSRCKSIFNISKYDSERISEQ